MTDDDRARATTPPRLAVIITATLLGGMIAAVGLVGAQAIEPGLTTSARQALIDAGVSGVDVRFDGREAFLSSSGASPSQLAQAERVVEAVDGVRWATIEKPDPAMQAQVAVSADDDGVVTVTGTVGTAAEASAIQDAAVAAFGLGTVSEVVVDEGVAVASWAESTPQLFDALAQVDDLEFTLDGGGAFLSGAAVDPKEVAAAAQTALGDIPLSFALDQAGPTAEETAVINGTVILFIADSVTLDAAARDRVAELADALRRFPEVPVTLTGHIAIPVGTEADAIAFSLQRAQAVADALTADGIAADRIDIEGAGSSRPVGDNATAAGAAANRRVTVLIMEGS
jgi:outer membrane protein OmpA-like peptidoglycan-associated protein